MWAEDLAVRDHRHWPRQQRNREHDGMSTLSPGAPARRSVEVLRFAPCPLCHCRRRVLDEEDGVQTPRCLECGEVMAMNRSLSRHVRVVLPRRR